MTLEAAFVSSFVAGRESCPSASDASLALDGADWSDGMILYRLRLKEKV